MVDIYGILLFATLFAVMYMVLVPRRKGLSLAAATVDNVRYNLIKRLAAGGKQEKLNVLKRKPEEFLKNGLKLGGLAGVLFVLLTFKILGPYSLVFLFAGFALGVYLAEVSINQVFRRWQSKMLDGIPALVDFMPAFLEVEGVTARAALQHSLPFLAEPLRSEMTRAVDTIKRTGNAEEALMDLASRTRENVIAAICYRLATAWDASISSNLFLDLREEVAMAKELATSRATAAKKGLFAMVCVFGLIGLALLGGYPALMWIGNAVMTGFGG